MLQNNTHSGEYKYLVDYKKDNGPRCWNFGLGPACCLKHHEPLTVYGGCKKCNKEFINDKE